MAGFTVGSRVGAIDGIAVGMEVGRGIAVGVAVGPQPAMNRIRPKIANTGLRIMDSPENRFEFR
jgi:hypothetical protein